MVGIVDEYNLIRVALEKIEQLELVDESKLSLPSSNDHAQQNTKLLVADSVYYEFQMPTLNNKHENINGVETTSASVDGPFTFGPVSAEFKSGEITMLVGENG